MALPENLLAAMAEMEACFWCRLLVRLVCTVCCDRAGRQMSHDLSLTIQYCVHISLSTNRYLAIVRMLVKAFQEMLGLVEL